MAVFYIPDFHISGTGFNALNKSRDDLHKIYQNLGFQPLLDKKIDLDDRKVKYFASNTKVLGDYIDIVIDALDKRCHDSDFLFMDFPFAIKFAGYSKIVSYARTKGVKVIFFIHDLDGVRFQNMLLNMVDSACLDMAYCLISASSEMDEALSQDLRVSNKIRKVNYRYWDYLTEDIENNNNQALICFAGNLAKSSFISQIPSELISSGLNLYGKGMKETYKGSFKGEFNPQELVKVLDGKFGLVWDGNGSSGCTGNFGKYLKINTSHKFGLYMATGKPVIVWSGSSIADFVIDNRIGIAVNSLNDIAPLLSKVSVSEYLQMKKNILPIRKDVISGLHLSRVILESMKEY
ncbi:MAG: hypothetical protein WCR67_00440 [Bacilli bacterium]